MLSVILFILKIIGIILGSLIALILGLILIVLFAPVRYKLKGSYYSDIEGNAHISWLFHIIYVKFIYSDKKFIYTIKIFGLDTNKILEWRHNKASNKHKRTAKKYKRTNKSNLEKEKANNIEKEIVQEIEKEKDQEYKNEEQIFIKKQLEKENKKNFEEEQKDKEDVKKKKVKSKKNIFVKIKNIYNIVKESFKKILAQFKAASDKLEYFKGRYHEVMEFFENPKISAAIKSGKKQLLYLIKHYKPNKLQVFLKVGFKDPSTTGQVVGAAGVSLMLFQNSLRVVPDFENEIIESEIMIKGKIRVIHAVIVAAKLFFNRNVKYLVRKVKKIRKKSK